MTFDPGPKKQAQEVIFSRKIKKTSHPPLNYCNNFVKQVQFQKYFSRDAYWLSKDILQIVPFIVTILTV